MNEREEEEDDAFSEIKVECPIEEKVVFFIEKNRDEFLLYFLHFISEGTLYN